MIVTASELQVLLGITSAPTDAELALLEMVIPAAQAAVCGVLRYDPERGTRKELLPGTEGAGYTPLSTAWESNETHAYMTGSSEGGELLQLRFLPIRSIVALYEDSMARHGTYSAAFGSGSLLVEGDDFMPEYDIFDSTGAKVCTSGLLRKVGGSWSPEPGTVMVEYVAGYDANELTGIDGTINARPIKEAVLMTAVKSFRQYAALQKTAVGFVGGIKTSETLGDYAYTIAGGDGAANSAFSVSVPPEAKALLDPFINYGACFQ